MALTVIHAHQTALPNDAGSDVSANAWNAAHTVTGSVGGVIDKGAITPLDLIQNGPITLYTPAEVEFVWVLLGPGFVNLTSGEYAISPFSDYIMAIRSTSSDEIYFSNNLGDGNQTQMYWESGTGTAITGSLLTSDPVLVILKLLGHRVTVPEAQWTPATPVVEGQTYIDPNDNVQIVTVAGTTGGSEPTWDTDVADTTADNDVTWQNCGPVPTGGGHIYLMVSRPVSDPWTP